MYESLVDEAGLPSMSLTKEKQTLNILIKFFFLVYIFMKNQMSFSLLCTSSAISSATLTHKMTFTQNICVSARSIVRLVRVLGREYLSPTTCA